MSNYSLPIKIRMCVTNFLISTDLIYTKHK